MSAITPATYKSADLVLIKTITMLHPGTGRGGEVVDLPVQRDEYGFPMIYSSSIKGALKSALYSATNNKYLVKALLGPEPAEFTAEETFESSIAILDSYLAAFPARSLKGVYVYVTSPLLLKRFIEHMSLVQAFNLELKENVIQKIKELKDLEIMDDEALILSEDLKHIEIKELKENTAILCEEIVLKLKPYNPKEGLKQLKNVLKIGKEPLIILSDNIAKEVCERSMIRITRTRLNRETKTVAQGALWAEEYITPRTIFHTVFLYKRPPLSRGFMKGVFECFKKEQVDITDENWAEKYIEALSLLNLLEDKYKLMKFFNEKPSEALIEIVKNTRKTFLHIISDLLKHYLIIGGSETIGKGIVKLEFPR